MKTINDDLFSLLVRYHLTGDHSQDTENRIKSLLQDKINSIADRNRWQKEHKQKEGTPW